MKTGKILFFSKSKLEADVFLIFSLNCKKVDVGYYLIGVSVPP
jgi:hypothetical protein